MLNKSNIRVKDLLNLLRANEEVTFRTAEGYHICTTRSDSVGIIPYKNSIILEWLPFSTGGIGIYIDIKELEN